MGELTPIEIDKLSAKDAPRVLYRAVVQSHSCLESHIQEQNKVNAEIKLSHLTAAEKRQELADDLLDLKSDVLDIKGSVAALAQSLGGQVQSGKVKIDAPMRWKDIGKIVLSILGAIGGLIFLYQAAAAIFPAFHHYVMSLSPT